MKQNDKLEAPNNEQTEISNCEIGLEWKQYENPSVRLLLWQLGGLHGHHHGLLALRM